MGEIAETTTAMATATKKKKKGRPSLLDLQKRALKQQQQLQRSNHKNPNSLNLTPLLSSSRRSNRKNPNSDGIEADDDDADDDDDDERAEKKHKLLLGLNSRNRLHSPIPSNSSDLNYADEAGEDSEAASLKRRKIGRGSDEKGEKVPKATDVLHGSPVESGPTTPLPDKKLLVFILDRLQKKDTYGVFSEPVDAEELPDYHEIIAHPMDFSTVRKKLDEGAYANLEQFERDVFLICTNAMEYNSPDTIYFRQARSMHEMAKKDFENLRQDSDDDEPQPKVVRRGRPPGKSLKKQLDAASADRVASEYSADATLATGGDSSKLSGAYNLRRGPNTLKFRPADTSVRPAHSLHNGETHGTWLTDWESEFPASVVRAVMKYGMKHFNVDENRRDTYNQPSTSVHEPSVLTTLEDELKQLIPVGLSSEFGYARSLARFAADLGPVAWRIASKKLGSVLPSGINFGPGWVGGNPNVEDPQQPILPSGRQRYSNNSLSDDHSSRVLSPTTSVSNSFSGNRHSLQVGDENESGRRLNSENDFVPLNSMNPMNSSSQIQKGPLINSDRNGFISGFGYNHSHQMGMVRHATPPMNPGNGFASSETNWASSSSGGQSFENLVIPGAAIISPPMTNHETLGVSSQQGLSTHHKPDFHQFPPDLNAILVPSSPSSNAQIGSSQQPDLALQL